MWNISLIEVHCRSEVRALRTSISNGTTVNLASVLVWHFTISGALVRKYTLSFNETTNVKHSCLRAVLVTKTAVTCLLPLIVTYFDVPFPHTRYLSNQIFNCLVAAPILLFIPILFTFLQEQLKRMLAAQSIQIYPTTRTAIDSFLAHPNVTLWRWEERNRQTQYWPTV